MGVLIKCDIGLTLVSIRTYDSHVGNLFNLFIFFFQFSGPKKTVAPNTNECYFWRTTGCYFGENCHYLHIKKNRGIDLKVSRSKYYYYKRK